MRKHEHRFQFIDKIERLGSIPEMFRFMCECGVTKIVEQKPYKEGE